MLSKEDRLHNKRVAKEQAEKAFPRKVKIMIGSGIFIGLCIAIFLFIGFFRGLEFSIRHF